MTTEPKAQFSPKDLGHFRDVVAELIEPTPSEAFVRALYDNLPKHIKSIAEEWGTSDTVFRDMAFEWLREHRPLGKISTDLTQSLKSSAARTTACYCGTPAITVTTGESLGSLMKKECLTSCLR